MSRFSLMIVSLVLFVIGLFVIFSSINWGSEAASAYLRSQGGGMDSTKFMVILQEYITMYRWMGGILSIVSGAGLIKALEPR